MENQMDQYVVIELNEVSEDRDVHKDVYRVWGPFNMEALKEWRAKATLGSVSWDERRLVSPDELDTSSTTSRQHYIDTGHYMLERDALDDEDEDPYEKYEEDPDEAYERYRDSEMGM